MITFSRQQHIIWQIIVIAIILANYWWFNSVIIGVLASLAYLWFNSKKISDIFFGKIHQGLRKTLGLITILAYISVNYTLAYHFYAINDLIFIWVLISLPFLTELISYRLHINHYFLSNLKIKPARVSNIRRFVLPVAVIVLDLLILILLFNKASVAVVRSPWELLGFKFWFLFVLSNIFLLSAIIHKKSSKNIWLISWHLLLMSSIAVILYPLGFGYDSFIHQAALDNIATTGSISPRLFLYIGQYGISFFFSSLSQISLVTVNRLLLPILFSILWPSSIYYGLRYGFGWSYKTSYLAIFWSLFVGFSFAIMTTPQSLVFLLMVFAIFLMPVIVKKEMPLKVLWLIAVTALSIHPLGGVHLFFLAALVSLPRWTKLQKIRMPLYYTTWVLAAISLPLLFVFYELANGTALSDIIQINTKSLIAIPTVNWFQTYNFPLNMLHNIGSNQIWLYTLAILIGIYLIITKHKYIFFRRHLAFILILVANYLLAKIFLAFNLQIAYQKDAYLNRIVYLIALAALPIFVTTVFFAIRDSLKNGNDQLSKLLITIVTVIIISASTYFSYPIYDQHGNSKSFNVTASDIKTVQTIADDAGQSDYIVLANQMVGAAAINQFGFKYYHNGNFYYSMPLGTDNIYQNYLMMIEQSASRQQALLAMDKASVDKLYFVVNNYWHSAKQAITQASASADEQINIDSGVNRIFIYNR